MFHSGLYKELRSKLCMNNDQSSRLQTINTELESKTRINKNIIEDYHREARRPPGGVQQWIIKRIAIELITEEIIKSSCNSTGGSQ